MKVAVIGATGVLGRAAVRSLVAGGHDVFGLARTAGRAALLESLDVTPVHAEVFDRDSLVPMFEGCDVVCNLATRMPLRGTRAKAWREQDRLRTAGARAVVEAARLAGIRRLVQESTSTLYADQGERWVTEDAPLDISAATEPASVAETWAQSFASDCPGGRASVILRLGQVVGEDPATRQLLAAAQRGRPVAYGDPDGWVSLLHTDDLGEAVLAAVDAPGGVYNVGADPIRRRDWIAGLGEAAGRSSARLHGRLAARLAGERVEPLTRSLRISTEQFTSQTGWTPSRGRFDLGWLADGRAMAQ